MGYLFLIRPHVKEHLDTRYVKRNGLVRLFSEIRNSKNPVFCIKFSFSNNTPEHRFAYA